MEIFRNNIYLFIIVKINLFGKYFVNFNFQSFVLFLFFYIQILILDKVIFVNSRICKDFSIFQGYVKMYRIEFFMFVCIYIQIKKYYFEEYGMNILSSLVCFLWMSIVILKVVGCLFFFRFIWIKISFVIGFSIYSLFVFFIYL